MMKSKKTQATSLKELTDQFADPTGLQSILEERRNTHGDYSDNAETYDALTKIIDLDRLDPERRLAMDVILQKLCRIQNGNPNFKDHWDDIAGYATLASKSLD